MLKYLKIWVLIFLPYFGIAQKTPSKKSILKVCRLTNQYFMNKWPDPGLPVITNKKRPSNLWTRGIYYEGLMDFYKIDPNKSYYDYAVNWGKGNNWSLWFGVDSRHADSHCAGISYIDLYNIDNKEERIKDIKASIDKMLLSDKADDWTWIDALQMAMPVFAKLGVLYKDDRYFEKMYDLYNHSKNIEGGGLFNKNEGLWWRDKDFVAPYKTPSGKNCYWSRGNGWVIAALVKTLEILPKNAPHYKEYETMYLTMINSLVKLQRNDGYWNVSLTDENDFGGKELTGTALFTYGIAWGIRNGYLDSKVYKPIVLKSWKSLTTDCVHKDGKLGWVQGTGKQPSDGQPLSFDKTPDFEDYGLGCFLLVGTEMYLMK